MNDTTSEGSTNTMRAGAALATLVAMLAAPIASAELQVDNPAGILPRGQVQSRQLALDRIDVRSGARIVVPLPQDTTKTDTPTAPSVNQDTIEFQDRDRLHGALVSLTPDAFGLVWKRSDIKDPIALSLSNLMQVRLAGRRPVQHKDPTASVTLLNGDLLAGDIVAMDETSLTLDTWYSGRLTIKRPSILQVDLHAGTSRAIYEGPNSLTEWMAIQSGGRLKDQWRFDNGTLFAIYPAPLVKRLEKVPDLCEFHFSVSWTRYASFGFMFFTDVVDQNATSGYNLMVSGSTVYMQAFSRNMGSQQLGTVNYEKFDQGKRSAEFTILANRKTNTFTLLIDGEQVRRWTDARNLGGTQTGHSIMLQPQDQNSIRFRNIRVLEWDGKVPEPSAAPTVQKEDIVLLSNSDKLTGRLNAITNGNIQFTTSYATLTVPVQRVDEVFLAVQSTNIPPPASGNIRLTFAEAGQITVKVEKIADEKIRCSGDSFGDITLPLPAIKTMDFNLDKKRLTLVDPFASDMTDGVIIDCDI